MVRVKQTGVGPTLVDVCHRVKDTHIAQYLHSADIFSLAGVCTGMVEGVEIAIQVDPYFAKQVPKNARCITLWQARNLVRAGAIPSDITFKMDPPHHWVGRTAQWYSTFHFMLKDFSKYATTMTVSQNLNMGKILWLGSDWIPHLQNFSILYDLKLLHFFYKFIIHFWCILIFVICIFIL